MTVGVLEIAAVPSPKGILGRLDYLRARFRRRFHNGLDFCSAPHEVADREFSRATVEFGNPDVMGKIATWPDRQLQSRLKVEKCDCTVLKLRADDPLRRQTKTVPIKRQRFFQIVDAKREN